MFTCLVMSIRFYTSILIFVFSSVCFAEITDISSAINIAGRQRMLSQHLAKFYMMRTLWIDNSEIIDESQRATNEFRGAMVELESAKENTKEIKLKLAAADADADAQWQLLDHGLKRSSKTMIPLIVSITSEKLLKQRNEITDMYETLYTSQKMVKN